MKKKQINLMTLFFLTVAFNHVFPIVGRAEDSQSTSITTGFYYDVIFPENQIGKEGYFDLLVQPGQTQIVEVMLENPTMETKVVTVSLNGARTNSNGVIEYGASNLPADDSMAVEFTEIVQGPKEIELKPQVKERLKINIQIPKTGISGMVLGGIQLQEKNGGGKESDQASGAMIVNKYAYMIGMKLSQTSEPVKSDLNVRNVQAGQANFRNAILIDLGNNQPSIMENLTVDVQIKNEKKEDVLFESKKVGLRMAPNSLMNFPVLMENQAMVPGKYQAIISAVTDEQTWQWTENFTITKEEAKKYNQEAIGLIKQAGINWKLVVTISFCSVLFLGVLIFVNRKRLKSNRQQLRRK